MSQSSETTTRGEDLLALGYPEQMFENTYYTARVSETHGACIAPMIGAVFIQFFPWKEQLTGSGHVHYCAFIMRQAQSLDDKYKGLPYFKLPVDVDLLTIKCLIEEGIAQCNELSSKSL